MKNAQSEGEGEEEEEEDEDEGGVGKTSENDHAGRGGVGTNILAQAACRWQCHPGSGRRDPALECQRGREESSIHDGGWTSGTLLVPQRLREHLNVAGVASV